MIETLIYVLVLAVVIWLLFYALSLLPLPPVVHGLLTAGIALVLLLWLLDHVGVHL